MSQKEKRMDTRARYFLYNKSSINDLIDRLNLPEVVEHNGGQKVTIIEAYAGAGTITNQLLRRSEVGRVIAMETTYPDAFKSLFDDTSIVDSEGKTVKDKLHHLPRHTGFLWTAYEQIVQQGLLDHLTHLKDDPKRPAHQLAPIVFVAQLPNTVHGDQLFTQLVAAMANGEWLFQYGRVRMAFVMPEVMAKKATAKAGEAMRARIGTLSSILSRSEIILPHDPCFEPQKDHVYPPTHSPTRRYLNSQYISRDNEASGNAQKDLCAFMVTPKPRQVLMWKQAAGIVVDANEEKQVLLGEAQQQYVTNKAMARIDEAQQSFDDGLAAIVQEHKTRCAEIKKAVTDTEKPKASTLPPDQALNRRLRIHKSALAQRKKQYEERVKRGETTTTSEGETAEDALLRTLELQGSPSPAENKVTVKMSVAELLEAFERDSESFEELRAARRKKTAGLKQAQKPIIEQQIAELDRAYEEEKAKYIANHKTAELMPKLRQIANTGEDPEGILLNSSDEKDDGDDTLSKVEPSTPGIGGIQFESLDYLMRALFILRSKSVAESLSRTYPGAQSILSRLAPPGYVPPEDDLVLANVSFPAEGSKRIPIPGVSPNLYIDPSTPVIQLTDEQWLALARTFERWPFRPEHLFEESKVQLPPGWSNSDRKRQLT